MLVGGFAAGFGIVPRAIHERKAKFRDHVRSKTPMAMVNEVLCKCSFRRRTSLGLIWSSRENEPYATSM